MKPDFSVPGRENALFRAYFGDLQLDRRRELSFARWTLLEQVIWQYKPPNTYCYLDGYDFDRYLRKDNGFVGVGRVWLLPEPGTPGDIATTMAVEFDLCRECIRRAFVWVGPVLSKRKKAPKIRQYAFDDFFSSDINLGQEWCLAFEKDASGWHHDPGFDLSIFLMRAQPLR